MNIGKAARWTFTRFVLGPMLLALLPMASPLAGQDSGSQPSEDSGMAPARIRAQEGAATLQRQQEQDRVDATLNAPVFPGDLLQTEDGRVEVELPDGSVLWIDSGTRLEIVGLGSDGTGPGDGLVLQLHDGTLEMENRGDGAASGQNPRIDTPEASVYLMASGRFRIESDRGRTALTSLRGVAELAGDESSVLVRSGQKSEVARGSAPDEPWAINTLRLDDFDQWCEERLAGYLSDDQEDEREYVQAVPSPVRHYVAELDNYGDWQWNVDFGWIWRPTIYQVGWRPYTNGYWSWSPYGWTWVAYEPWGWGPYHYGRWSWVVSAGWVWIPGGVYSSAWVSWSVTPTYIGWCPLDFYNRPAYLNVGVTNVAAGPYGGGWNFLPLNRFNDRNAPRLLVKADRVPNLQGAVTTRVLPRFSPEQARTRPDVARQILRDSGRYAFPLQSPERGSRQGLVSFRVADRREASLQRGEANNRRPAGDAGAPISTPRRGRDLKARPGAAAPGSAQTDLQNPHEVAGAGRSPGGRAGEARRPSPSADKTRPSPAEGSGSGTVIRKEASHPLSEMAVRPRREATPPTPPNETQDAPRRVLHRILGEGGATPGGASQPGVKPRTGTLGPGDSRRLRPEAAAPSLRTPPAKAEPTKPKAQRPRPAPPPRKQDEKKDKP